MKKPKGDTIMRKMKRVFIAILALATLGVATGCEGLQFVTPPMGENSSSGESSKKDGVSLTDEQWDEFVEIMEKSAAETNRTIHTTMTVQAEQSVKGLYEEWMSEKGTTTEKTDGRLEEYIESMKHKESEDGAWETRSANKKSYKIYPKDYSNGEAEGEFVSYTQNDDGEWTCGSGYYQTSAGFGEEYEALMTEELREVLVYNAETGIYSITDEEITTTSEAYLGMPITNGQAVQKIHKMEYEVKDGYLVRAYQDYEVELEGTIEINGETYEVYYYCDMEVEGEFGSYGTTKITLPSQIKDEVEALLQDEE